MLEINVDKVKEFENRLIYYDGFLPIDLMGYIDMDKRNEYLKKNGKFEELQKQYLDFRIKFKKYGLEYRENVLKEWILDNPQFKNLFILE